jgi:CheY-like chemotaxis protein
VLRIETRIPDPESAGIDDPDAPPGGWVRMTVSDTGTGMDEETRTHIFDPFFTTKEIGKGTGLGLASVYGIVKGHGGRIRCESEPGRGTIFHIDWPAMEAESSGEAASAPSVHGTGAEAGSEARGGGETVLVVDDEDDIRELTAETLEARGYAVLRAAGGEEALERYAEVDGGIHLVVLDLGMPGMGGMRCLEALRRMDPGVRVIVASGYSDAGREAEVREAGAVGFVAKPFQARELLLKVREALDKGGAGA